MSLEDLRVNANQHDGASKVFLDVYLHVNELFDIGKPFSADD